MQESIISVADASPRHVPLAPHTGESQDAAVAGDVLIRPRINGDLPECEVLARWVHDQDGYPPHLPGGDFARFLSAGRALGAWVAVDGGHVVGHVALHPTSSEEVMAFASSSLDCPRAALGVVARLLVEPTRRREGIGLRLATRAADAARNRRLRPILDVATQFKSAIHLYEALGWRRLGQVAARFPGGQVVEEFVYADDGPIVAR